MKLYNVIYIYDGRPIGGPIYGWGTDRYVMSELAGGANRLQHDSGEYQVISMEVQVES